MIILKNIKKEGTMVSADYCYPNDEMEKYMDDRNLKYSADRWREPPAVFNPACSSCIHRNGADLDKGVIFCEAFPNGIPRNILITTEKERDLNNECTNGFKYKRV